ncbi:hypothetical protein [Nocardioides sp. SR21]|uniref:hypothetical protein n=1 Tax=Nocardioides sp. SR21 TaxID=2919501 RepID=UPI001FAA9D6E|nr:hypothetical protein [Nocardioides sp. SR21]
MTGATVLALVLTLAAGACSGSEDSPDEPAAVPPSATPAEPPVETKVLVGKLTGRLPKAERVKVVTEIGAVVEGWTQAAYVGGDYPRRDFADSWPGFTAGARALARKDQALMSNQDVGTRIDGVEVRRSRVVLDVLSVEQLARAVTARVLLEFRTTGSVEKKVRVQGRLYLTHEDAGWQVFGYDMTKGAV